MLGFEPERLTPRERRLVLTVLVLTLLVLAAWLTMMVLMLPEPSHGI